MFSCDLHMKEASSLISHINLIAFHNGSKFPHSSCSNTFLVDLLQFDYETGMSASTMEAVAAIDDAIDEALDDEPTPPKRQCPQEEIVRKFSVSYN